MLIFNDNNETIILDSIHTPIMSDSFWILDLGQRDFTITPLLILEEIIAPSMRILINGFEFYLPATWNVLVIDEDTSQLDLIEASNLAGKDFQAFTYGPNKWSHGSALVRVVDFTPSHGNVAPSLSKHQMLCHPIDPSTWINIAPSDTFNRYLKGSVAGDLT